MEVIKFKTNVDNEQALARVAPYLDREESISRWKLDIGSTENILSISGKDLDPQRIENVVKQAGFKAEIMRVIGIGGSDL